MTRYLALLIAALTSAEMQAFELAPKLVVNITIDQLRSDYIEAFSPLYSETGFRRILRQGLVYDGAQYPFTPVDAASAAAAISTGTTPYYNGIIGRQWLNRETLQPTSCIGNDRLKWSARSVKTSTVGDELKVSTNGQAVVLSFAATPESAIMSAGHAADGAFWYEKGRGFWGTTYYSPLPEWLKAYNAQHPYSKRSEAQTSTNDRVVDVSLEAVDATRMGQDDNSDLLYVSLSAAKGDGTPVTHWQTEMESVYTQLDQTLSRLISGIEKRLSLDKVLFIITSTGYAEETRADLSQYRIPTGTFYINRTANLLNIYLGAFYGQGRYVEQIYGNQMFLNRKLLEQKRISMSEVLSRSQEFLMQNAGVADVYTSERLLAGNADILKLRGGFSPALSGDIIVEVAPGWKLYNEDTQEQYTSRAAFVPFPIIFMGMAIKPMRVSTPVTVDRIAPTVAKAIRIRAPNACNESPLF